MAMPGLWGRDGGMKGVRRGSCRRAVLAAAARRAGTSSGEGSSATAAHLAVLGTT